MLYFFFDARLWFTHVLFISQVNISPLSNGFASPCGPSEEEDEAGGGGNAVYDFSLENTPPINDKDFDEVEYEKDDSW